MEKTVVIPSFNSPERVDCLLESLFKFSPGLDPKKVIISDDCSPNTDRIKEVVERYGAIFTSPSEWKCVGGNTNHVVSLSKDDLVFVINDDILISKGSLETMQKFWEENQHLNLGAVGFTFIQRYQLKQKGIIKSEENFYPSAWNTGDIKYNANKFVREEGCDPLAFPSQFLKPIVAPTSSGPCFAISKTVWEQCGKFHEFGMWEGGVFHTMWEKGWIILDIPTPPMLHGHGKATGEILKSAFLKEMYNKYPHKRPWNHAIGEKLYKQSRGRYYEEDSQYIWNNFIYPKKDEILELVKYNFDASVF